MNLHDGDNVRESVAAVIGKYQLRAHRPSVYEFDGGRWRGDIDTRTLHVFILLSFSKHILSVRIDHLVEIDESIVCECASSVCVCMIPCLL